jgi:hypothetical protein
VREDCIQRAIVGLLNIVLLDEFRVFACPNAARRTVGGRAANAVAGLRAGVPDLILVGQGRCYFIEVKAEKGRLSPAQDEWRMWCSSAGAMPWALVRSVDDVKTALTVWNIPTRQHRIM